MGMWLVVMSMDVVLLVSAYALPDSWIVSGPELPTLLAAFAECRKFETFCKFRLWAEALPAVDSCFTLLFAESLRLPALGA